MDMPEPEKIWWKDGVVYQVYPASFKDSNGDGLGDIPGIISKLDYLRNLGVDIVWVSPMFESPQVDMGYDISNYEGVHAPYGTVHDMEVLVKECHQRGMRLILDLVINHTSDQHAWFKESRSSRDNPKRDWYIWKPPRLDAAGNRTPPTNWRSYFSGSTWEWDEATGEYYLHLFASCQPDLNWENPETREAIYNSSMRFWMDKGVDGFRVDCVNMYSKGTEFPDAPVSDPRTFEQPGYMIYCNGPRMHEFLRDMNTKVLNKYDAMTVGELPHTPDPKHVLEYVRQGDRQLDMVFQFDIVDIGQGQVNKYQYQPWTLSLMKNIVEKWQKFIDGTDGWTTAFCENHDQGRSVSRFGSDKPEWRVTSAKMLALMMCAMTGTLYVYQGQEIGMINVPTEWKIEEDYKDIEALNYYATLQKGSTADEKELEYARMSIQKLGRDNARIPMQWDSSPFAGFTDNKDGAWMRVHDLYGEINVAKQEVDEDSVLSFWKKMIKIRKEHRNLFTHGTFELFDRGNEESFVFTKTYGGKKAIVALNFTSQDQTVSLPEGADTLLAGNYEVASGQNPKAFKPWEGRIYLRK